MWTRGHVTIRVITFPSYALDCMIEIRILKKYICIWSCANICLHLITKIWFECVHKCYDIKSTMWAITQPLASICPIRDLKIKLWSL